MHTSEKNTESSRDWVRVGTYFTSTEADIAGFVLQENGIEFYLKHYDHTSVDPLIVQAIGGIWLMVPQGDELRAKSALESTQAIQLAPEDQIETGLSPSCQNCGSKAIGTRRLPVLIASLIGSFVVVFLLKNFFVLMLRAEYILLMLVFAGLVSQVFPYKKICFMCKTPYHKKS